MREIDANVKSTQVNGHQNSSPADNWQATLGQELLTLWQQAHGAPLGAVTVTSVQSGLLVFLENAFSKAELALTQQSTDNLLPQYIDRLTNQILPLLTSCVEQLSGRKTTTASVTSNIEQNWMMIIIRFEKSTAPARR